MYNKNIGLTSQMMHCGHTRMHTRYHQGLFLIKWCLGKHVTFLQLHELEEFTLHAYENAKLYKEKTKKWHDKYIESITFEHGLLILLFISRLKLFPGKLRSNQGGTFEVVTMTRHGAVELRDKDKSSPFLVNGQRGNNILGITQIVTKKILNLNEE